MLVCFKKQAITTIQSTTQSYVYKLIETNPERFDIIFNYGKCRFNSICSEFNSTMIPQIKSDYFLLYHLDKLQNDFKQNIISTIVKSSCSIPISSLSNFVQEKPEQTMQIVKNLIINGSLNYRIDKVNNVIIEVESSIGFITYKKAIGFTEKTYYVSLNNVIE